MMFPPVMGMRQNKSRLSRPGCFPCLRPVRAVEPHDTAGYKAGWIMDSSCFQNGMQEISNHGAMLDHCENRETWRPV